MSEYGGITQLEFIAILFEDCGYTAAQRRDWLGLRFAGRRYADELSVAERSAVISALKEEQSMCRSSPSEEEG